MKLLDYVKSFSYGGIFGLLAGKCLYNSFKHSLKARNAGSNEEKETYSLKSKCSRILAGLFALSGLSGLLLSNEIGPVSPEYLLVGEGLSTLIGFQLSLRKDEAARR